MTYGFIFILIGSIAQLVPCVASSSIDSNDKLFVVSKVNASYPEELLPGAFVLDIRTPAEQENEMLRKRIATLEAENAEFKANKYMMIDGLDGYEELMSSNIPNDEIIRWLEIRLFNFKSIFIEIDEKIAQLKAMSQPQ